MNIKKLLASTMASVMAMSMCATSAFAADVSSGSTNVTATVTGAYTITVPQTVTLTGADGTGEKTATIPVCIKGDIGENQKVTVTTVAPVMKSAGSADVTATIDAPKTEWNRADVIATSNEGTTSNYTVKATLTPGEWDGTVTFNCALSEDKTASEIYFTVNGKSYKAEKGMTWTQLIWSSYNPKIDYDHVYPASGLFTLNAGDCVEVEYANMKTACLMYKGSDVSENDTIIENGVYTYTES